MGRRIYDSSHGVAPNELETYIGNAAPSRTVITNDIWYHVAITYDGTNKILYVNGDEIGRVADSTDANTSTDDLMIGDWTDSSGRNFKGVEDDVRIYSRAMSANEIRTEMEKFCIPDETTKGSWKFDKASGDSAITPDFSGNGNHGTHIGTFFTTSPPILRKPIYP